MFRGDERAGTREQCPSAAHRPVVVAGARPQRHRLQGTFHKRSLLRVVSLQFIIIIFIEINMVYAQENTEFSSTSFCSDLVNDFVNNNIYIYYDMKQSRDTPFTTQESWTYFNYLCFVSFV